MKFTAATLFVLAGYVAASPPDVSNGSHGSSSTQHFATVPLSGNMDAASATAVASDSVIAEKAVGSHRALTAEGTSYIYSFGFTTYGEYYDLGDNVNLGDNNFCDTVKDEYVEGFPFMEKIMFWAEDSDMVLELYTGDYCTGRKVYDYTYHVGQGGSDGNKWWDVNALIKSFRIYDEKDFPDGHSGIGIKLAFFPQTGMFPYNEISCIGDKECNEHNNYCNQLLDNRSPYGGPNGNCVSSDDFIWRLDRNHPYAIVKMNYDILDFAGQTCGGGDEYLCSFNDYPIGSIYLGLWFSTHQGDTGKYYGSDFPNGNMDGFCDYNTGENDEVDYIRSSCIYTHMWKSDVFNDGHTPDFWEYPFVETIQSVSELCHNDNGACFSICQDPNDFCPGGPMKYHEDANTVSIYGGTTDQNEPVACDGGEWPLWTSYIASGLYPCPDSWVGSESTTMKNEKLDMATAAAAAAAIDQSESTSTKNEKSNMANAAAAAAAIDRSDHNNDIAETNDNEYSRNYAFSSGVFLSAIIGGSVIGLVVHKFYSNKQKGYNPVP